MAKGIEKIRLMHTFPFGLPIEPRPPLANPGGLFVLGAYPSVLHVRWAPPSGNGINALAVDNEPEPFWDGSDEADRVEAWKQSVGFTLTYGTVSGAGARNNGPSGAWVRDRVLSAFGATRASAWITDCLDTYRASMGQAAALSGRFASFAAQVGITAPELPAHPSENEIVREALGDHRDRLLGELQQAHPTTIVTLGNAAMRVLRGLVRPERDPGEAIGKTETDYGQPLNISIGDHRASWHPLCHPAAPAMYQALHDRWRQKMT